MWTGRQTLSSIEDGISRLNAEESQLDAALRSAGGEAERLRRERNEHLRELARIKLDEMTAGRLVRDLDAGERRASQVLENRRLKLAAVAEQRDSLRQEVAAAQNERNTAAEAVEKVLAEVEALRAEAEARVHTSPDWQKAEAAFRTADAIAVGAEKKAAQSESELSAKRKPYDDDRLFSYLWARGYGTSRYAAAGLTRFMDRRVADYVGFFDARPNYVMLTEIPARLREHAALRRAFATEARTALAEIEHRAMLAAGVDARERVLTEARHRLAAADDLVEKKRGLLKSVEDQRTALLGGTDPAYTEALSTIADADAKDDIGTLYREARRTPTMADEAIITRISAIDKRIADADAEVAGLRGTAQDLARRRLEVERVRDRFRSAGYDHPHATFGNESAIADAVEQIVRGAVRSGLLWDLLRAGFGYRQPRSRGDFGGPSFPFPFPLPGGGDGARGGEWRVPGTRGGWSTRGSRDDDDDDDDDDDRMRGGRGDFETGGRF